MTERLRKIIHIDMDAFFAAVEQRDHPHYRNKPLVVGGLPNSRGVVSTCSYEARQFGIHSAMPSAHAYRLCPQAIFVQPRFEAYREASTTIRRIFAQYTDIFEPLSLDEAYLDVSDSSHCHGSATLIAKAIKQAIWQQTCLTASAGVSYNKFLAKIASDINKPNGLYLITPEQGATFVETLPVGRFHGIGKATEKRMHELGIYTGLDLKRWSKPALQLHFGKAGLHYYQIARGVDERPVNPQRERKSVGVETTFAEDITDAAQILAHLQQLLAEALLKLEEKRLTAYTVTVKIKYQNFVQITRSRTLSSPLNRQTPVDNLLLELLKNTGIGERKIRLLGVTLSSLQDRISLANYRQVDLFDYAGALLSG